MHLINDMIFMSHKVYIVGQSFVAEWGKTFWNRASIYTYYFFGLDVSNKLGQQIMFY
jgi:hypothetical protein